MGKVRDLRLDNFKGVLIVLVVVGHYLWGYKDVSDPVGMVVRLIYIFHMPAFIFASGYFSKDSLPISWRGIAELLVSYFLINTTMMLFVAVYKGSDLSLLSPYYSCWYLVALVFWRISLPFFSKYRFALVLSIVLSLAVGFSPEITNKFALARTIAFYPFFIGGFLFKKSLLNDRLLQGGAFARFGGALVFVGALVVAYFCIGALDIKTSDEMMQAYGNDLSNEMLLRVIVLVIATLATLGLLFALPSKKILLITAWGKNSLTIYLFHRFFTLLLLGAMPASQFSDVYWPVALVASFATLFVFGLNPIEGGYRNFVKRIVAILFAGKEDGKAWKQREALVLVVSLIVAAIMVGQSFFN